MLVKEQCLQELSISRSQEATGATGLAGCLPWAGLVELKCLLNEKGERSWGQDSRGSLGLARPAIEEQQEETWRLCLHSVTQGRGVREEHLMSGVAGSALGCLSAASPDLLDDSAAAVPLSSAPYGERVPHPGPSCPQCPLSAEALLPWV